ncbi:MAG TPA: hypothetical protein QF924_14560 [Pseudomonadales bacterium]|jgi:hypothetical protein|nr:hypothetical protein [Pseudomonadales bacterium]
MAGLLHRLSQDYADGLLDRDIYRQRRAELIDRILNAQEDITRPISPSKDAAASKDVTLSGRDPKSLDLKIPLKSGLLRWSSDAKFWLLFAAAITAMLIVGLLYSLSSDSRNEGAEAGELGHRHEQPANYHEQPAAYHEQPDNYAGTAAIASSRAGRNTEQSPTI